MIQADIPGFGNIELKDVVFDFNGTLAVEGKLIAGVAEKLELLSEHVNIHVLTADTFGRAASQLKNIPQKKRLFIRQFCRALDRHTTGNTGRFLSFMQVLVCLAI